MVTKIIEAGRALLRLCWIPCFGNNPLLPFSQEARQKIILRRSASELTAN